MAKIYRKFRGLANSSRNFQSFQRYHSLALQFLGIVYPSIPSAPFAQASLKVTIQIGKVGESIWQYSQFVSRRAQCYQVYIYIYIYDTNPTEVWVRYQRPTDFSFNWVFFQRSPLFGGNIGSKTGFLPVQLYYPQPLLFTKRMEGWHFTRERFIYIYICFLVLLLLLRSLFTAQRRRSVALSPPRICSLGKCENRIDQCLDETGGGIEEKVGNRCLNYSHWNSINRVYWADW